ncbi:hypothetical protein GALMADRAFT_251200 [Galerina marginata CBS 339.88]|uniref:Mid2 domain-containing protein n=1 Tax=Galerina marginata (strain CBS 339.88) TaxID=685588 RepID=A0A067STY8_GALM3|nr:hypothetical protein GALMADRAFT_251200 [Galerina marginata CBS 339.88]
MLWRLWPYVFLWLATVLRVTGQSSNVTQCVASYSWSVNSLGQTPCLVAAYLESLCGVPTSVDSIPNGTHYLGPTNSQQDPCKCSSVTYSMVSACGGCQGRTFQNWTTWDQFCIGPEVSTFPKMIPAEVEVPKWAFIDITAIGNTFDPMAAQQNISGTFPTASPPSSATSLIQSTPPAPTILPAASTSSIASNVGTTSSTSHSNAGAIAGGVIGGLVFLAIIVLGLLWYFIRKRRNAVQTDVMFDSRALVSGHGTLMSQPTGTTSGMPSDGSTPVPFSHHLYDSSGSDGSPLSPLTSGVYTSPQMTNRRSLESVSPSMIHLGGYQPQSISQPGAYRGAAEV